MSIRASDVLWWARRYCEIDHDLWHRLEEPDKVDYCQRAYDDLLLAQGPIDEVTHSAHRAVREPAGLMMGDVEVRFANPRPDLTVSRSGEVPSEEWVRKAAVECMCGHVLGRHTLLQPHRCLEIQCECESFAEKILAAAANSLPETVCECDHTAASHTPVKGGLTPCHIAGCQCFEWRPRLRWPVGAEYDVISRGPGMEADDSAVGRQTPPVDDESVSLPHEPEHF